MAKWNKRWERESRQESDEGKFMTNFFDIDVAFYYETFFNKKRIRFVLYPKADGVVVHYTRLSKFYLFLSRFLKLETRIKYAKYFSWMNERMKSEYLNFDEIEKKYGITRKHLYNHMWESHLKQEMRKKKISKILNG